MSDKDKEQFGDDSVEETIVSEDGRTVHFSDEDIQLLIDLLSKEPL